MTEFLQGEAAARRLRQAAPRRGLSGVTLSFLLGMAVCLAVFLPFLVVDRGFFLYCGDYNSQQLPFYMYVQQFIKQGGGTWSWATDLGSSVVNSYSFYNLGSPFLWITLLFPSRWLPFLMVPLFMLKFGAIAAGACMWLSRYAKTRNMAVICSVAYAFCGFNVYNIFFNHMLDPVAIFPLMLWALDGYVYEKKRGWFALFTGLSLLNSFFFFLGNVVFVLLYFIVKAAAGEYRLSLREFLRLAFEVLLGAGLGMALALPSFLSLVGNPRTSNFASGFGLLLYGRVQQYFAILSSLFLPPDPPYLPNLFTDAVVKWTSMSAFLPVVGVGGVIAYCRARRGGSVKLLLLISLVMAMVPILNSSFYAFNASYYARWYYMPLLIMALATLRSLEDADIDLLRGAKAALVATCAFAVFGLAPVKDAEGNYTIGLAQKPAMFWLTLITAAGAALLFYLIVRFYRRRPRFAPMLLAAVTGVSVFYALVHISLGKFPQWERDSAFRAEQYDGGALLAEALPDDTFYRMDVYYKTNEYDNLGLWAGKSNLHAFNSVVTPSIMEFYPLVGETRDVSSKPETKHYALRGLLSARFVVLRPQEVTDYLSEQGTLGWRYYSTVGPFEIYENENFVPLGFTYDEYLPMESLEATAVDDRAPLLMRAIGLDEEQIARYGHLFSGSAIDWRPAASAQGEVPQAAGGASYAPVGYADYVENCGARRASASYEVRADASGFTSKIILERDNLVFYGVPYDPGFTALVNGRPAEVLKVSGGMMAVRAGAGDNTIVFTYRTPGFGAGLALSLGAAALLAAYWALSLRAARRRAGREGARGGAPSLGVLNDRRISARSRTSPADTNSGAGDV